MSHASPQARRKAYSYTRFSRPEQARGASRKRQAEGVDAFVRDNDLDLHDALLDVGSAFRGKNRDLTSALGGFIARVDKGDIERGSVLIVESFDRLSREQVLDAQTLFLRLLTAGIELVTLLDGRSYTRESVGSDFTQLIISIILMSRAYKESATKGKRVGDAWRRKREAAKTTGQAMTARAPGWLELKGGPKTGHYVAREERATVVRSIFLATIAGDGRRTISKRLNAAAVETWGPGRSKATQWHDSYIAKILSSHATYGRSTIGGHDVDGYFPPVIDEETFWRAQAATAGRSRGNGRTSAAFKNILRGLARCEACSSSMVYVNKGKRSQPTLVCSKAHAAAGCGNRTAIPYRGIEHVIAHAYCHFADRAMFALDERARQADVDMASAEERRSSLAAKRDNLVEAVEAGAKSGAMIARIDALETQISEADRDIAAARRASVDRIELADDIEERMDTVMGKLNATDPEERYRGRVEINARLRQYLDHVILLPDGKIQMHLKPGFEDIDANMMAAYGGTAAVP